MAEVGKVNGKAAIPLKLPVAKSEKVNQSKDSYEKAPAKKLDAVDWTVIGIFGALAITVIALSATGNSSGGNGHTSFPD